MAAVFLSLGTGASLNSEDWKCYLKVSIEEIFGATKIYELSEEVNLKGHQEIQSHGETQTCRLVGGREKKSKEIK